MAEPLEVLFWRGSSNGRYQIYEVPRRENQTVLDVVTWVQRHLDATLSYRFACRVGMCGSCAMTVNGKPRWSCRTHVSKVAGGGRLTIGPIENLPVITERKSRIDIGAAAYQQGEIHRARGEYAAAARDCERARLIEINAVLSQAMPPGNVTEMTPAERQLLATWFAAGKPM